MYTVSINSNIEGAGELEYRIDFDKTNRDCHVF